MAVGWSNFSHEMWSYLHETVIIIQLTTRERWLLSNLNWSLKKLGNDQSCTFDNRPYQNNLLWLSAPVDGQISIMRCDHYPSWNCNHYSIDHQGRWLLSNLNWSLKEGPKLHFGQSAISEQSALNKFGFQLLLMVKFQLRDVIVTFVNQYLLLNWPPGDVDCWVIRNGYSSLVFQKWQNIWDGLLIFINK